MDCTYTYIYMHIHIFQLSTWILREPVKNLCWNSGFTFSSNKMKCLFNETDLFSWNIQFINIPSLYWKAIKQ